MEKSDELMRFEADISGSEELRGKLEETLKRIAEGNHAESDGEALVKAATELGYTLSIGELERVYAEYQALSDEELATVAGGRPGREIGGGEDRWCLAIYYCDTVMLHDDAPGEEGRTNRACWSDWECLVIRNHP